MTTENTNENPTNTDSPERSGLATAHCSHLRVLVACEYSGTVRDAFSDLGHDAMSCDILPTDKPGKHYQGDVRELLTEDFDLLVAHPPCTYLTNSGVCWLHKDALRWPKMYDGAEFFRTFLDCKIPMKAVENPIMHKYAARLVGRRQSQVVQPWMFGHLESKATGLWLENLPLLKATNNVKEEMMKLPVKERQRLHYLPPSKDRWKLRSTTYSGIAEAMAEQWSFYANVPAHPIRSTQRTFRSSTTFRLPVNLRLASAVGFVVLRLVRHTDSVGFE